MKLRTILALSLFCLCYPEVSSQTRDLGFYLRNAESNNALLKDLSNQAASSIADSLLIRAGSLPQVDAKSQLLYSPFYKNFGYDEVITDGGNYSAQVAVTQSIFNKRDLNNRYSGASIQRRSVNNTAQSALLELRKNITSQYLVACSDQTDLKYNLEFLTLINKEFEIVGQFVKNGIALQSDYLAMQIEIQSQKILIRQLKSQSVKDLILLNRLSSVKDTSYAELVLPELSADGQADIRKSPFYIQYQIDSVRIQNERSAIAIRYRPRVSWFADAGILTSYPWNFYKHFGYSAGLAISIPLYDGKQRLTEDHKLDLSENTRQNYNDAFYREYFQQVSQLESEIKALDGMLNDSEEQLKTAVTLVNDLRKQLESGNIQMTEYLSAIKNLRNTNRNINMLRMQKLQVVNELNYFLTR